MVQADVIVQNKRFFGVKNISLCYKSNGQRLACVHPIWIVDRALWKLLLPYLEHLFTLPSCSLNYPRASRIGWTHARRCPFPKTSFRAELSMPSFNEYTVVLHLSASFWVFLQFLQVFFRFFFSWSRTICNSPSRKQAAHAWSECHILLWRRRKSSSRNWMVGRLNDLVQYLTTISVFQMAY